MMNISEEHNRLVKLYAFTAGATSPTPKLLCEDMVYKLNEDVLKNPNNKFLDPCAGTGTFGVVLYERLLKYHSSDWIMNNMIFMVDISSLNCDVLRKIGFVNVYNEDFLKWETRMKFDVILGNPPYQIQVGPNKTEPIWHKFVEKSFELTKDGGCISLIHPAGWRNVGGRFTNIRDLLLSNQLEYLSIHNEKDGLRVFGAETRYDWYIIKKSDNTSVSTVRFQDNLVLEVDLRGLTFLPNSNFHKVKSLIAKNTEERVNVLHSTSKYETRNSHMNREKTSTFKYPVVYTINSEHVPTFYYSSVNNKGYFGIPKFIWSNGRISSIGSYIDESGEFGLTQFSYGIVDLPENLPLIKKAFDSIEFRNLMESCAVGQLTVNHKIIAMFRKDFWKEFI